LWDDFSVLPKEDVPEKGVEGSFIYKKLAEIFFTEEMMSDLEILAWSAFNPNPVTLRKYLCFQGKGW